MSIEHLSPEFLVVRGKKTQVFSHSIKISRGKRKQNEWASCVYKNKKSGKSRGKENACARFAAIFRWNSPRPSAKLKSLKHKYIERKIREEIRFKVCLLVLFKFFYQLV